jgi:hypothetical protein
LPQLRGLRDLCGTFFGFFHRCRKIAIQRHIKRSSGYGFFRPGPLQVTHLHPAFQAADPRRGSEKLL